MEKVEPDSFWGVHRDRMKGNTHIAGREIPVRY